MLKRLSCLSAIAALSVWSLAPQPTVAQTLLPYAPQVDWAKLEEQGLTLAQEATQLAQLQQYRLAVPRAQLASQLAPGNYQVWALLGSLYIQTNDLDKGISALQKARSLDQKNSAVLFALGSAHFQKAQYDKAVESIRAGLAIKPDVPGALFDLGNAYYMLNRFPDAIAHYEKALKQDAKFWPAINNIGLIKYEVGEVDNAIRYWKDSIAIDTKAAEPQLALAVALYTKGSRNEALALGEAALQLDSRYANLDFLKENLWGDRLMADTKRFLETPRIQAALVRAEERAPTQPVIIHEAH